MDIKIEGHIKALIFDVDGTLADSMTLHLKTWEVVGNKYGFHYSRKDLEKNAGKSGQEIVEFINEENGLQLDPDFVAGEKEDLLLANMDQIKPIRPVIKLLESYHGYLPIAAGTGGFRRVAAAMLKAMQVWNKIDVLVASDDVKYHKPYPDTFLLCAEKLNVNPADCLVFEDADLGFRAAKNAGMQVVDVRPFYEKEQVTEKNQGGIS